MRSKHANAAPNRGGRNITFSLSTGINLLLRKNNAPGSLLPQCYHITTGPAYLNGTLAYGLTAVKLPLLIFLGSRSRLSC